MSDAPQTAEWFLARRKDGSTVRVHFAQNLSGEEQPAFSGFFRESGRSFAEVCDLVEWDPSTLEEKSWAVDARDER